jgi:hypothetical protein
LSKVLAYCAYLKRTEITLPPAGVSGAPLQLMARNDLRLVWSQVEWPFATQRLQQFAVEFHGVVGHVFRQAAVAPFQLLTVFDGREALAEFARRNEEAVVADLERLKGCVQMECVAYVIGAKREAAPGPDETTAQYDPEALLQMKQYAGQVTAAVAALSREVKVREVKSGSRIFALVDRGQEQRFLQTVHDLPLPGLVSRRFKGPGPAVEFLSVQLEAARGAEEP